jgi:hypothetical protein
VKVVFFLILIRGGRGLCHFYMRFKIGSVWNENSGDERKPGLACCLEILRLLYIYIYIYIYIYTCIEIYMLIINHLIMELGDEY